MTPAHLLAACPSLARAELAALGPDPSALALMRVACGRLERVVSDVVALRLDGAERAAYERLLTEARALVVLANSDGAGL